jgi:hypothetical protein
MTTSRHEVAIIEPEGAEPYLLVRVDLADIEDYGEEEVWEFVTESECVTEQQMPVLLFYFDEEGQAHFYGDEDIVQHALDLVQDQIRWDFQCTIEWPEEGPLHSVHDAAVFEEGFMVVAVDPEDIVEFGEEGVWDIVKHQAFLEDRKLPVVIAYVGEHDEVHYYGEDVHIDALKRVPFEDINWGHEITIEWPG